MKLLIKFPTRERPFQFFNVLYKAQLLRELEETKFLITLDEDDSTMKTPNSIGSLGMWGNLKYIFGQSHNKIHAVNRDMETDSDWDILLLMSDDMHPIRKGYDKIIVDKFVENFADTDGVLWMNDGATGKELNTLCCIGKKYYERFGYIYHPSYKSLWCDNEFTEVSQQLEKVIYIDDILIQHKHPMNQRGVGMDRLYQRNNSFYEIDRLNYQLRKANNFDLILA